MRSASRSVIGAIASRDASSASGGSRSPTSIRPRPIASPSRRTVCSTTAPSATGEKTTSRASASASPRGSSSVLTRLAIPLGSEVSPPKGVTRMAVATGTAVTDLDRFLQEDGRDEAIARVRERIDREGVKYVYYQFASVTGRVMGKGVPAPHWERMATGGFQLVYGAMANLFIDRHGNYIGYGPEAAELVGLPEPETFEVLPWDRSVARVWCISFRNREERENPGGFLTADCRGNLKRIQAAFESETGLHLRAGAEPEMMWLKLKPDGTPDVQGVTKPYCYHIDQFSELQPIIHKVVEYGQALGLDMIQGDHEDAPGQIELNFGFDRAEKTADNLSTFRQLCKQVGRELGVFPCFMPKPFMGVSANGCHHNISLWRGDENAFLPDTDDLQRPSQIGLWAIGGIIEHLPALTAVTASTVNSYRR